MNKFLLLILLILVSIQSNSQEASDNWVFHHQPDDGWFGSIVKDNNGNIIVGGGGSNSHFRVYDGNSWALYRPEDFNVTYGFHGRDIAIGSNNILWIAQGNTDGLTSWDGTAIKNYNFSNSNINSNSVFGVGVDSNNNVLHTGLQSFNGNEWKDYPRFCTSTTTGVSRKVSFSDSGETWITGGISINIDLGIIYQPCIYHIKGDSTNTYHLNEGDNIPELNTDGYHLVSQINDGSILLFGSTNNGIEVKIFNGSNWDDFDSYTSNEVQGSKYFNIYTEDDNTIWLCGSKTTFENTSQLVKYCKGEWTVYNLPESDGFPSDFRDVLIDGTDLWAVGITGIWKVEIPEDSCENTSRINFSEENQCKSISYEYSHIQLHECNKNIFPLKYLLINSLGQTIKSGTMNSDKEVLNIEGNGIFYFRVEGKNNEVNTFKILAH